MSEARSLLTHPIHLGLGGKAGSQPAFTGIDWYEEYGRRATADGAEGRLVSMYEFTRPWDSWERHPAGDEVVLCVSGEITLLLEEEDGGVQRIALGPGDYAINPSGVWHTIDIAGRASCVFITAGLGTEHRRR